MYGCSQRVWIAIPLLLLLPLQGCTDTQAEIPRMPRQKPVRLAASFNPKTAGVIKGRVTWQGEIPSIDLFRVRTNWPLSAIGPPGLIRSNPHVPQVDARSRGVQNAVVFLRGVDPKKSRPWDLPAVRVEQRDRSFHILQGKSDSPIGIVRRGDAVAMVSRDPLFHSLHAGGAAFFTVPFPDPDDALSRRLNHRGLVELTSAAGYYWMRAHLFVDDHPYYARTNAAGRFTLPQVPPGRYQLVCWLPNWHIDRHDRDPESSLVTRIYFAPPVEVVRRLTVKPREKHTVNFRLESNAFDQSRKH
jgi:hypothetical protein